MKTGVYFRSVSFALIFVLLTAFAAIRAPAAAAAIPAATTVPPATAGLCGPFSDLSAADPACAAILKLADRGVIGGFPDGTYRPESPVTRAQFAKMAVLAFDRTPNPAGSLPFSDTAGHWATTQGFLQTAMAMDAINGFPDGTFRPDNSVTRAQAVKITAATLHLYAAGTPPYTDVASTDWYSGWAAVAHRAALIGPAAFPVWTEATFLGDRATTRAEAAMLLANLPLMPAEAKRIIAARAAEAVAALQSADMTALAALAHPARGIRFSPYAFVRMGPGGDRIFPASELTSAATDPTLYLWGVRDGSGLPIELTFSGYYDQFIYDRDFALAPEVSYNVVWQRGNTVNNVLEAYPGSVWVEYHYPGFDPAADGMDWQSLRLVFSEQSGTWYLVGVIHDQWTI